MNTLHIKKGDTVVVLSGVEKGKSGKVVAVYRWPQEGKTLEELPNDHAEVTAFKNRTYPKTKRQELKEKLKRDGDLSDADIKEAILEWVAHAR